MSALANVQVGRTRLLTRFEVAARVSAGVMAAAGATVAFILGCAVAAFLTGTAQLLPVITTRPIMAGTGPLIDPAGTSTAHVQFPVNVTWPDVDPLWPAAIALVLTVLWVWRVVVPLQRRVAGENLRHRGLAKPEKIRKVYGPHAVRKAAKFTLPNTTRPHRLMLGTSAFGMNIGKAITPKGGGDLWVNLEQRVRIVARPGWGKTLRLLVPIIRQLQGPALISTTEPELFTATVKARQTRRPPSRVGLLYQPDPRTYPVAVVDCSPAEYRISGGFPTVRWNPIPGCEDFAVATRRAAAIVKGVDEDPGSSGGATTRWFEDGATAILAAWLHAAALTPGIELADLAKWLGTSNHTAPTAALQGTTADPAALSPMQKFLDKNGGKTTVNLEMCVGQAIKSLISVQGSQVCGSRTGPQFDMEALIRARGTMYLLGDPSTMKDVRPLLSLIASEMFVVAERIARTSNGKSPAFYAILDELRSGVRIATLPDIASEKRKYRLSFVYAVTNGGDEEALYGEADAARLKAAAGTSIYGGLDELSADDITSRAGRAGVVTASKGGVMGGSESTHDYDVLTASDMQQLGDGESVIVGKGILPFLAFTPATYEVRALRRRICREQTQLRTETKGLVKS